MLFPLRLQPVDFGQTAHIFFAMLEGIISQDFFEERKRRGQENIPTVLLSPQRVFSDASALGI